MVYVWVLSPCLTLDLFSSRHFSLVSIWWQNCQYASSLWINVFNYIFLFVRNKGGWRWWKIFVDKVNISSTEVILHQGINQEGISVQGVKPVSDTFLPTKFLFSFMLNNFLLCFISESFLTTSSYYFHFLLLPTPHFQFISPLPLTSGSGAATSWGVAQLDALHFLIHALWHHISTKWLSGDLWPIRKLP